MSEPGASSTPPMEPDAGAGRVCGVDGLLTYPVRPDPLPGTTDAVTAEPLSFVAFYEKARDRTVRALALTLGDAALAAEAVDEAMVRAYQRWDRISHYQEPAAWVYRVAVNWATSILRRRNRTPKPHARYDLVDLGPVAEPDVAVALSELGVRQRAVVVCRFYLGFSEAETAAALGIRPGTVKSRLHRALQHLQGRLSHLRPEEQS